MAKRRRTNRSEKEWFRLVAEQERSGQTQDEYCRAIGISGTSFQRWRKRRKARGSAKFIEIKPQPSAAAGAKVEVEVVGGVTLRIWS